MAYRAFASLARIFCILLEGLDSKRPGALQQLHASTAALYAAALTLPAVADGRLGSLKTRQLGERRTDLYRKLKDDLPIDQFMWMFEPLAPGGSPVTASLADALADIWYDLKPGLEALESLPAERHNEIWCEWRFSCEVHWGRHAVEVLAVFQEAFSDS